MKRIVVIVVRGIAGIAGVVFLLCPLSTWTLVVAFGSSVAVFLICQLVLAAWMRLSTIKTFNRLLAGETD
jgi:hypothetical protein